MCLIVDVHSISRRCRTPDFLTLSGLSMKDPSRSRGRAWAKSRRFLNGHRCPSHWPRRALALRPSKTNIQRVLKHLQRAQHLPIITEVASYLSRHVSIWAISVPLSARQSRDNISAGLPCPATHPPAITCPPPAGAVCLPALISRTEWSSPLC